MSLTSFMFPVSLKKIPLMHSAMHVKATSHLIEEARWRQHFPNGMCLVPSASTSYLLRICNVVLKIFT